MFHNTILIRIQEERAERHRVKSYVREPVKSSRFENTESKPTFTNNESGQGKSLCKAIFD